MKLHRKAALGLIAMLGLAIIIHAFRGDPEGRQRTAEAQVVGFVATPSKWQGAGGDREGHTLTYAWVDGADSVHAERLERISGYRPATTYKVCYDAENPSDRRLYPTAFVCGS